RLELPAHLKIHPVVSVANVERSFDPDADPFRRGYERPEAVIPEDNWYEAEVIGKRVTKGGKTKYLVRWIGYPIEESQWKSEKDVGDRIIAIYEEAQRERAL
ncbi:hypothetical protein DFH27DRAFT_464927, partial [Peziza echinospora]